MAEANKKEKRYSSEFKIDAVKLVLHEGYSVSKADLPLRNWRRS
jgi:transposase-like protein